MPTSKIKPSTFFRMSRSRLVIATDRANKRCSMESAQRKTPNVLPSGLVKPKMAITVVRLRIVVRCSRVPTVKKENRDTQPVRLELDQLEELRRVAKEDFRTVAAVIRLAISEYLERRRRVRKKK